VKLKNAEYLYTPRLAANPNASTMNIEHVRTTVNPRVVLAAYFKSLGGEPPFQGGWGYSKEDACVIDKNDPSVCPDLPFDWIGFENVFVEKRLYIELIIHRDPSETFAGITWKRLKQTLVQESGRYFDHLIFEVSAVPSTDWEQLKAEIEGPDGVRNPAFDMEAHKAKRDLKTIRFHCEYWFDITGKWSGLEADAPSA
jgi:hypothetical protein